MESSSFNSQSPASAILVSKRVSSACERCRQQKLKCDVHRPCTLCLRAGATCSGTTKSVNWKAHHPGETAKKVRGRQGPASTSRAKRARLDGSPEHEASVAPPLRPSPYTQAKEHPAEDKTAAPQDVEPPRVSSSAAMQFVEEAFHQHDTSTPEGPETSAFSASHWTRPNTISTAKCDEVSMPGQRQKRLLTHQQDEVHRVQRFGAINPAEAELLSLMPQLEPATILVDNYFDRIHWFMLVFHQSDFRERFRQLYMDLNRPSPQLGAPLGFLGVFSAVCVVSLTYLNPQQKTRLSGCGVRPEMLRQQLLATLRLRLLDIVSQGSIEAVQTCILLGSFYLYHGEPELAWPICGSGLRIAQALNLHQRVPSKGSCPPDLDDPTQRARETRKRCWWAVYEIETFCSMLYGFPLSINDDDCDVELLDPYPLRSRDPSWQSVVWKQTNQGGTLLSYKYSMAQLSVIVKSTLIDLYGLRGSSRERTNPCVSDQTRLRGMIANVASLDQRLQVWYKNLPKRLRINSSTLSEVGLRGVALNDASQAFENAPHDHLFQLQALALKLAFENARILIHRPLLSYKIVTSASTNKLHSRLHATVTTDSCQSSIQTCRDAALQIATLSSLAIVKDAADTYAVSFISLHLLTAAVALSILASLDPLSQESYNCKMGIRRLMEMQSRLRARSIVAKQGLGILKKLMSLVLSKEREHMLEFPCQIEGTTDEVETCSTSGVRQSQIQTELCQPESPESYVADRNSTEVTSIPALASDTFANLSFDLYEDPMIAEALYDFEHAINFAPNGLVGEGNLSLSDTEQEMQSCFSNQDQSWIWGSNHCI